MFLKPDRASTRSIGQLASGAVLLGALFAVGAAVAQTRAEPETWKSHLSAAQPEVIFRTYCAVCHGKNGDGKSLAQYAMDPAPADFTSAKKRDELSRAHMIETLNKGAVSKEGKRTAMVAWKRHLSRQQVEAVVDYVIVSFMDGKVAPNVEDHSQGHKHKGHDHSAMNVAVVDYPYGLKPMIATGRVIYSANCAKCHGDKGDGRASPAVVGQTRPRDFHDPDYQQFASGFSLFSAVSKGRGHMPALEKTLSRQEIADVAEYILQTFAKPR